MENLNLSRSLDYKRLPVTIGFDDRLESIAGRIDLFDDVYEMIRANPGLYRFEIGYWESPESKEIVLTEVSLVVNYDRMKSGKQKTSAEGNILVEKHEGDEHNTNNK